MSYAAKILADSVGPHRVRIVTFELTFPRFILAELNTHCALARNSASSRAIPPEKIIERVGKDPFVPEFAQRVKGMGVGDPLDGRDAVEAKQAWMHACNTAIYAALKLIQCNADKSRVNRLLEPFMWHTAIVTATDWANFFAQRDHEGAQPEFRHLAQLMRLEMGASTPRELQPGEWHLPLVTEEERSLAGRQPALVSAGRVARVSFDNHWREEPPETSIERAQRLVMAKPGHWSPTEHPCFCMPDPARSHKYRGWMPLRKLYPNENVRDELYDA